MICFPAKVIDTERENSEYIRAEDEMSCLTCAQLLSRVQLFVTPWTVARLAPLSMGILQARILEWVAISFSRGPA